MKPTVNRNIFNPDNRKFLLCGRPLLVCILDNKNHDQILRDFSSLYISDRCTKIVIGIANEYEAQYPNLIFVGNQTDIQLADWLRSADCTVFPAHDDQQLLELLESMACGTPVAAHTEKQHVIQQGITGYSDIELTRAVHKCLDLNRNNVYTYSK